VQIHVRDPIPHTAAPRKKLFSWSTRHHCPVKVGAYVREKKRESLPAVVQWTITSSVYHHHHRQQLERQVNSSHSTVDTPQTVRWTFLHLSLIRFLLHRVAVIIAALRFLLVRLSLPYVLSQITRKLKGQKRPKLV